MKSVGECISCGARLAKYRRAAVAPFLAQRVWGREPFRVRLVECSSCGLEFFDPRLEPEEEQRLYAGYRGEEYLKLRWSYEPWYTAGFNAKLSTPELMAGRRTELAKRLGAHVEMAAVRSILDFGGGTGDLVAGLQPSADPYVYDISGENPAAGVQPLRSSRACTDHHFDLVVCSNVLEHVGFPRDLLVQINEVCAPGTLVYLEVPLESPRSLRTLAKRFAQQAVLLATRRSVAFSTLRLGTSSWMHEHVSFFSPSALSRLIDAVQWKILAQGVFRIGQSRFGGRMVWALARAGVAYEAGSLALGHSWQEHSIHGR